MICYINLFLKSWTRYIYDIWEVEITLNYITVRPGLCEYVIVRISYYLKHKCIVKKSMD